MNWLKFENGPLKGQQIQWHGDPPEEYKGEIYTAPEGAKFPIDLSKCEKTVITYAKIRQESIKTRSQRKIVAYYKVKK